MSRLLDLVAMSQLLRPENLQDRLLLAIPKKGRLYETCISLLNGADIQFKRAHRLDVALVTNLPIALVFLPAADIPRFVGSEMCIRDRMWTLVLPVRIWCVSLGRTCL